MTKAITIEGNAVTVNLEDLIRRKAARGRGLVHTDQRYRDCRDNLADALLDLMAYAAVDGKDWEAELGLAAAWFAQDVRGTRYDPSVVEAARLAEERERRAGEDGWVPDEVPF